LEIMTLITEIQNEARSIPRPSLYILSVEAWVRNEGVKVVRAGR
jgi:hypothetical protein